jgi:hypothetical protein
MAAFSDCKVVLAKKDDKTLRVEMTLRLGLDRVIAAVPSGTYTIASATCDRSFRIKIQYHSPLIVPDDGVLFLGTINIDRFRPTSEQYSGSLRIDSRSIEPNQSVLGELKTRDYKTYWYEKPLAP